MENFWRRIGNYYLAARTAGQIDNHPLMHQAQRARIRLLCGRRGNVYYPTFYQPKPEPIRLMADLPHPDSFHLVNANFRITFSAGTPTRPIGSRCYAGLGQAQTCPWCPIVQGLIPPDGIYTFRPPGDPVHIVTYRAISTGPGRPLSWAVHAVTTDRAAEVPQYAAAV